MMGGFKSNVCVCLKFLTNLNFWWVWCVLLLSECVCVCVCCCFFFFLSVCDDRTLIFFRCGIPENELALGFLRSGATR